MSAPVKEGSAQVICLMEALKEALKPKAAKAGACETCGGEGTVDRNVAEMYCPPIDAPVECSDCEGTGKRYEDCPECGERSEFETFAYSNQCAACAAKARPRREER